MYFENLKNKRSEKLENNKKKKRYQQNANGF